MCVYYYKAYDGAGSKKRGIIDAPDERAADRRLRRTGLRPYVICDFEIVKSKAHKEKRRRKQILISGVVSIVAALWFSGFIVGYAGRQKAPDIQAYEEGGVLVGATQMIFGATPVEREFAQDMADLWDSYAPGTRDGLEATTFLVTVYANPKVNDLTDDQVDLLVSQIIRAQRRRFHVQGPQVIVVLDETTLLEAVYSETNRSIDIVSYE